MAEGTGSCIESHQPNALRLFLVLLCSGVTLAVLKGPYVGLPGSKTRALTSVLCLWPQGLLFNYSGTKIIIYLMGNLNSAQTELNSPFSQVFLLRGTQYYKIHM